MKKIIETPHKPLEDIRDSPSLISSSGLTNCPNRFINDVVFDLGLSNFQRDDDDEDSSDPLLSIKTAKATIEALAPKDAIQLMLAAQMSSVHKLQQRLMMRANNLQNAKRIDTSTYLVNTAIKLSNLFVQQANLMDKLQNGGQQKVTIEHVSVNNGGQAIIGTVNPTPHKE